MATASTTTMSQPPPPPPSRRPPPPPPKGQSRKTTPPPPRGPPPPPPKHSLKRKAVDYKQHSVKSAKTDGNSNFSRGVRPPPPPSGATIVRNRISIRKPVVLRDVSVFQKKYQVGQGTYG